jgi:hypothetical protein
VSNSHGLSCTNFGSLGLSDLAHGNTLTCVLGIVSWSVSLGTDSSFGICNDELKAVEYLTAPELAVNRRETTYGIRPVRHFEKRG